MITRFAPSPTGNLHLGHAYAAKIAHDLARKCSGRFLLRFEDIDHTRVRDEFYESIKIDLKWLGFEWDEDPWKQLDRLAEYEAALEELLSLRVLYPCYCTRKDIQNMVNAPQGPEGPLYPGTCRENPPKTTGDPAWRLNTQRAAELVGPLTFSDRIYGSVIVDPNLLGDVVLARKDIASSYHLAVVVDDAAQQVSIVTRGEDLLPSTHIHRVLQSLLGLPEPEYHHHRLIVDAAGKRLAKRDGAASIRSLREHGRSASEVLALIENNLLRQSGTGFKRKLS